MTYEQTVEFLFNQLPSYHRIGKAAYKEDLNNIIALDSSLGHPHQNFQSIHVGGTNGKGSVSHMIASVLQEAGIKTGLYTSPHLKDFRERIKINGQMIPKNEVVEFVEKYSEIIRSLKPSFFEMTVAMAFDHFSKYSADVAVIEVGLGGRLDSTNIINPVLSLITNIGHDHMDLLGNSLEGIAYEKAGIIKRFVPVVVGETQKDTAEVFLKRAYELGSEINFADRNFTCFLEESDITTGERPYVVKDIMEGIQYKGSLAPGGDYQAKNLLTVFQAFKSLRGRLEVTRENITDGIRKVVVNTGLCGRWQILSNSPLTICDTGHNREGLEIVTRQIRRVPKSGLHMIIGFVNDKDLSSIFPLFPRDAKYYFTRASVPRALDENILREQAMSFGLTGESYSDVKSAFHAAKKAASASDMIFIGGSTFVVADVL